MRTTMLVFCLLTAMAWPAAAQTGPNTLRLTVDDAVRMMLDRNVELAADRLDTQISDTAIAAAFGAFKPTFTSNLQRNNQLQPPANFLFPIATRTDVFTSSFGLSQRLRWYGASYSVSWTSTHTDSNSVLNSYNPLLQSGLSFNVSQPLLRDRLIDADRAQVDLSRTNREIADTRLRERLVQTTAAVKRAYWNLVSANANVEARKSALALAEELTRVNKAKVDVGQSPQLDLVSAQAESTAGQEALIIAETAVKQAEDVLRMLIFDPTDRAVWSVQVVPAESPPVGTVAIDVDQAVTTALRDRTDLARLRKDIVNAETNLRLASNQRLPDVRVNASYLASGLGGTQVIRAGGFPGTVVGPGEVRSFGSVLNQLFTHDFPTWTVGASVSYPIGQTTSEAEYARNRLERAQADQRLKGAEGRVIQEIRNAAWNVEMNAKRIETARASRDLAEQRLDAERRRFEVGISTSFLVIQAQRDLTQATSNELAAVLAYNLALVDFEALQQARSAAQPSQPNLVVVPSTATSSPPAAIGSAGAGTNIPGVTAP